MLLLPWAVRAEPSADSPAKTHQLFVGTDMKVQWDGDYVEVARFEGSHVVVRDEAARPVIVAQADNFRWERRPKVSRAPLTISHLDHTRLYSINRDPATKWNVIQTQMSAYRSTQEDLSVGEHVAVVSGQGPNQATMKKLYGIAPSRLSSMEVPDHGQYSEDLRNGSITPDQVIDASAASMISTFDQSLNVPSGEYYRERIDEETDAGNYDSFELRFDIASREPIADAHAMITASVVTPKDATGSVMIIHERLGKLDTKPRRITVRKAGLADGFKLENIRVQIYAQGSELGSNLSERSRSISADEARGFLLLAHLSDHRGQTLAPQPVWELAPRELWAAANGQAFDYPVVVSLNEHGQILGVHRNQNDARASLAVVDIDTLNTKPTPGTPLLNLEDLSAVNTSRAATELDPTGQLPPQIVSLVGRMVFSPALEKGVPIPSYTTVNLADFFR